MSRKKKEKLSKSFPSLEVNDNVNLTPHNKFYHKPSNYFGIKQHPNTAFSHLLVKDTLRTQIAPAFFPALQKRNFPLTKAYIKKKKATNFF